MFNSMTVQFDAYNAAAMGAGKDAFGKTTFPVAFRRNERLLMCAVTPAIDFCLGGLRINAAAEVLHKTSPHDALLPDNVARRYAIPGLFAAGEVTGGLHGAHLLPGAFYCIHLGCDFC